MGSMDGTALAGIGRIGPGAQRVLSVIRSAGGRPMLVGGCVRDAIMNPGSPGKDIDVEVYGIADPDVLARALAAAGKVTEAGKAFGVLRVRAAETEIDISLPRRESKTGAGHRGFAVIPDGTLGFAEASARRDFTVNALMADPETGEITDCHGGLADLEAGILRHASAAFSEDPLRVLRAVQFAARFSFRLAPATAVLCRDLSGFYRELPAERVWCEVEKIGTMGTDITAALRVLAETGWERHFPQIADLHGVEQDPRWHPEGDVHVHSGLAADQAARLADEAGLTGTDRLVIVLAALLHDAGKVTHTQRAGRSRRTGTPGRAWSLRARSRGQQDALRPSRPASCRSSASTCAAPGGRRSLPSAGSPGAWSRPRWPSSRSSAAPTGPGAATRMPRAMPQHGSSWAAV